MTNLEYIQKKNKRNERNSIHYYKHLPSRVAISGISPHCAYGVEKGKETYKCLLCEQNIFKTANLYIKEY